MTRTHGTDESRRPVRSLGELPRDIAPARDLWPAISAEIAKSASTDRSPRSGLRPGRPTRMQWAALAAVVSALAIGIWLGATVLPGAGLPLPAGMTAGNTPGTPSPRGLSPDAGGQVLAASFVTDPRYLEERAALIRSLEEQLDSLPPETQQKVAASLKTIRTSMQEIQAALGRDPANALLQELLVNTYQDEMRVLTAVHEASDAGRGI